MKITPSSKQTNELVRYSRAGDAFHYRWAARRCLKMLYPNSPLLQINIEGSKENWRTGEYIIDIAEYIQPNGSAQEEIWYYQLKHTTTQKDKPFKMSHLSRTLEGFAELFLENQKASEIKVLNFVIVTNRVISGELKTNFNTISKGGQVNSRFLKTLKKYTKLEGNILAEFCSFLQFRDFEGDFDEQKTMLKSELGQIFSGPIENGIIDNIISLVSEKALPGNKRKITKEDILQHIGVDSENVLFPAPSELEPLENPIQREELPEILDKILSYSKPTIIHAAGGVGKSIFSVQLAQALPFGSNSVIYDCFCGGLYRNRSKHRHGHKIALVQIANELSLKLLCEPLIVQANSSDREVLIKFMQRLAVAAENVKKINSEAKLAIIIDAADNAEMAAKEFSEVCFVHELLQETEIPDNCRIVAMSRTERVDLLKPSSEIQRIELRQFNESETLLHVQQKYPDATKLDTTEFHRLTNNGNPRVQAGALNEGYENIRDILISLGPVGRTVDQQIESQLDKAVQRVKDLNPVDIKAKIDTICCGLVALPPRVPIAVLAASVSINESTVRSFISDLGRPLWLSDSDVHFRDEPTETWFRNKFSNTPEQIESYIGKLSPLAIDNLYVAEAIPSLFLQAGKYEDLIKLALNDDLLPIKNPIDSRNVRVYRLQFAFKAALKTRKCFDACKLALRAGEEMAGDSRQIQLLQNNIDLILPLQGDLKIKDLAFKRRFYGEWEGSSNVFTASLLSCVNEFKGEARGYLRAAENWLKLYFENLKKNPDDYRLPKLLNDEILELAVAHFNLFGAKAVIHFILRWQPPVTCYKVLRKLIRRFLDAGNFDAIEKIESLEIDNEYLLLAIIHTQFNIGKYSKDKILKKCLSILDSNENAIPKQAHYYEENMLLAVMSMLEACSAKGFSKKKIIRVLNRYIPLKAPRFIASSYSLNGERELFLQATALRWVLTGKEKNEIKELIPIELSKENGDHRVVQEIREFNEVIGGLLPWYLVRIKALLNTSEDLNLDIEQANDESKRARSSRYREYDILPREICRIQIDILTYESVFNKDEILVFFSNYLNQVEFLIDDRLRALRIAFHKEKLVALRGELENSIRELIKAATEESPENRANWYINLCRAVLHTNSDDASVYFDLALDAVSRFGDEIIERWESIVALSNQCSRNGPIEQQDAYRFIRCAELVGENSSQSERFDRNEAIISCARLSPHVAISALSRWRDREVGSFSEQLPALLKELSSQNTLSTEIVWCFSPFLEYGTAHFACFCLEKATSKVTAELILENAVNYLSLVETSFSDWQKLDMLREKLSINNTKLQPILSSFESNHDLRTNNQNAPIFSNENREENSDWEELFDNLDLTINTGIEQAFKRFKNTKSINYLHEQFWDRVYSKVSESQALKFLNAMVTVETFNIYDLKIALSQIPDSWHNKASVEHNWNDLIKDIGIRHASELVNHQSFKYFINALRLEGSTYSYIKNGIIEGLSNGQNLFDPSIFFGFVQLTADLLTPLEAKDLLTFALGRFEMHIDDDFGDGPWGEWLVVNENANEAVSGLLWSALGSSRFDTRWRATHCVRKLFEENCHVEINYLVKHMSIGNVGPFGYNKFPFYSMHAQLYLLIALARASIENPLLLREHINFFLKIALEDKPHVLMREFAAQIILNINQSYPETINTETLVRLMEINDTPFEIIKKNSFSDQYDSYWHVNGEVDTSLEFHHSYDFDRYWFQPLGEVFGVSGKQIEELATQIIVKELGVTSGGGYRSDPRRELWTKDSSSRSTWHTHGDYPKVDDYDFYLSYHSMLIAAGKLIDQMPIVRQSEWNEDEWLYWLKRHSLSRKDGKWISDRRDPLPLDRPQWVFNTSNGGPNKDWFRKIPDNAFLEMLLKKIDGEEWLTVRGGWYENTPLIGEHCYISSAFVSPDTSNALLNALSSYSNSRDFKLPEYKDQEFEFNEDPFNLTGWIADSNKIYGLDDRDPYSGSINYPPFEIGKKFTEILGLVPDDELRFWKNPDLDIISIRNELWSSGRVRPDEDPSRKGAKVSISLSALKELLVAINRELVVLVEIDRNDRNKTYDYSIKEEYLPTPFKIYIVSQNGKIRKI